MAYIFGDGFDCYAAIGDPLLGYWDSGQTSGYSLVAGRFAGGQALQCNTGVVPGFTKASNVNDGVHHITVAFRQTATLTGTLPAFYFNFFDGTTAQCSITFRGDGGIMLTSGLQTGTVLDTYTGAVSAVNTWFQFEFEVVISNTTGSWAVRKNGNTVNDRALGGLNTRTSANNYANKLTFGQHNSVNAVQIDDLLWRSDASSVPWVGDIRCQTRMPASDVSVQFARTPSSSVGVTGTQAGNTTMVSTNIRYTPITAAVGGTVSGVTFGLASNYTGNMKCAVFADAAGSPGAIVATATAPVTNAPSGISTFSFSPAFSVVRGRQYWIGFSIDTSIGVGNIAYVSNSTAWNGTAISYAAFPQANPAGLASGNTNFFHSWTITTTDNYSLVSDTLQDASATYVYDATPGHADLYTIAAIANPPVSTIAVTTRALVQKSDAGTRALAVQLKSGGTTVSSATSLLVPNWGWVYRTDTTDPATGTAWTASGVNAAQIGQTVVA